MALQYFSEERLDALRHQYSEDKLFQTLSPVLCELQEARGELDPVILWHEVEALRERLKRANHPETEVSFLISYLRKHLTEQTLEKGDVEERSEEHVVESMLIILLLLMFQLTDAVPAADKLDENPNNLVCRALAHILTNPAHKWYIEPMRKNLTLRKKDYLGNEIVLPVVDYMKAKVSLDAMDEIAKNELERILTQVDDLSKGLYPELLHISQDKYLEIWEQICLSSDMLHLMCKKEPRTYGMNFNFKMFCNVLGLLQNTSLKDGRPVLDTNVKEVNDRIGDKNYRNYITYYNQGEHDTNCAYTKKQLAQLQRIVADALTEDEQ